MHHCLHTYIGLMFLYSNASETKVTSFDSKQTVRNVHVKFRSYIFPDLDRSSPPSEAVFQYDGTKEVTEAMTKSYRRNGYVYIR